MKSKITEIKKIIGWFKRQTKPSWRENWKLQDRYKEIIQKYSTEIRGKKWGCEGRGQSHLYSVRCCHTTVHLGWLPSLPCSLSPLLPFFPFTLPDVHVWDRATRGSRLPPLSSALLRCLSRGGGVRDKCLPFLIWPPLWSCICWPLSLLCLLWPSRTP